MAFPCSIIQKNKPASRSWVAGFVFAQVSNFDSEAGRRRYAAHKVQRLSLAGLAWPESQDQLQRLSATVRLGLGADGLAQVPGFHLSVLITYAPCAPVALLIICIRGCQAHGGIVPVLCKMYIQTPFNSLHAASARVDQYR